MANIADLLPQLRIELPGIPEPVLVDGLNEAVDDFLKDAEVWRYTVPGLLDWTTALRFPAIAAGTEIPANTRVVRIDSVKYANDGASLRPVPFKGRQQLDTEYADWEIRTGTTPVAWTNDGPDTPVIVPIATADVLASLKIRVILGSVGAALTTLPDFVMSEFSDLIRYATLGRLMKIPGKDWTDPRAAGSYMALYERGVVKAKSRAQADYGQPARATTYGGI